jgi:hypothetical protein
MYYGKVEHEKKSQKSMWKGGVGEVIERLFVTIFSFVAGVTYSSTCTTEGFNSYVQTYEISYVDWLRMMCCAMFFLFVERELLVMK